jgi:hypothetical protein
MLWFRKRRAPREATVLLGDPCLEDWQTVSTLDRFGRGDAIMD